jgi:hypothetical protein
MFSIRNGLLELNDKSTSRVYDIVDVVDFFLGGACRLTCFAQAIQTGGTGLSLQLLTRTCGLWGFRSIPGPAFQDTFGLVLSDFIFTILRNKANSISHLTKYGLKIIPSPNFSVSSLLNPFPRMPKLLQILAVPEKAARCEVFLRGSVKVRAYINCPNRSSSARVSGSKQCSPERRRNVDDGGKVSFRAEKTKKNVIHSI